MFVSARRIKRNIAAGLGVAGRRMSAKPDAAASFAVADGFVDATRARELSVLARAARRYRNRTTDRRAAA